MKEVDKETIAALQRGDHKAFEVIFSTFRSRVRAFIFGYVKSTSDAEEITEEVFVKLWEGHASIAPERSLSSFLHTMARNAALNFLRRKFVRTDYASAADGSSEGLDSTAEDQVIARETALLIEMTVDQMPAQRRNIWRLSRTEGLRNDEIAARLGTTKHNVESQLSTALRQLRKVVMLLF